MTVEKNTRKLDKGIVRDFSSRMSYAAYLQLPTLLSAQQPVSTPEHHDEMLFIIQHQTTELWLKLVLHELRSARASCSRADDLGPALKGIARVKHIQKTLTEQWSVLATLTPTEYSAVPRLPGQLLRIPVQPVPGGGVRARQQEPADAAGVRIRPGGPRAARGSCSRRRASTTSSCAYLARARASTCPPPCWSATSPRRTSSPPTSCPLFKHIYENAADNWGAYEACEELVDLEDNFQLWRFRHLRTVQRTIGMKARHRRLQRRAFLQKALELTFFPELFAVRTEIGQ